MAKIIEPLYSDSSSKRSSMSWIPVIGDVVNGISSIIGTSMTNRQALKNQREAQAWNEKMNAQNQAWEEEMWNKNNAYNAPAAQVQRLMDAGINPNSAVGGMSQNATASQPQQPVIPQMNGAPVAPYNFGLGSLGDHMMQMELLDAQKKNIEADTQGKLASAGTQEAQQQLIKQQVESFKISNEWSPKEKEAYVNSVNKSIEKMSSEIGFTESQRRQVDYMVDNILPLQKDLTLSEISKAAAAVKELLAQASAAHAQAQKAKAEAGLAGAQTEMVKAQTKGIDIDNQTRLSLNLLNNLKTSKEIEGLELSNAQQDYLVRQLKTFGFNVSESDMNHIVKAVLLSQLGDPDAVNKTQDMLGTFPAFFDSSETDVFMGLVMNLLGNVATGYVSGRALGEGLSKGNRFDSNGSTVRSTNGDNTSSTLWFSSSPSTVNPQ